MALIIVGGIGFLTWEDIKNNKWNFKKYRMQSKVILSVTALLIVLPTLYFLSFLTYRLLREYGFLCFKLLLQEPQVLIQ